MLNQWSSLPPVTLSDNYSGANTKIVPEKVALKEEEEVVEEKKRL